MKRALVLLGAFVVSGCTSSYTPGSEPRRFACQRDGGAAQCHDGWRCGLEGFCFDPAAKDPRRCDRAFERDAGGFDCPEGWHCSVDGLCFDVTKEVARPCNQERNPGDAGPYDCAAGWLCAANNTCFNPREPVVRECNRQAAEASGTSVDCAPDWNCGYDGFCHNMGKPEGWACMRDKELAGLFHDCAPGWRCGFQDACYELATAGARACDPTFEQDPSLDAGSDCGPGWRCGLGDSATGAPASPGECQELGVGKAYYCDRDYDCEQAWRCNIISHTCLEVTDVAALARHLPTPHLVSPLLTTPTPSHAATGGSYLWPPGQSNGGGTVTTHAYTVGGRLNLLLQGKDSMLLMDGGSGTSALATCALPDEAAVAELSVWRDAVIVRSLDGGVAAYGGLSTPNGPGNKTAVVPTCQLLPFSPQGAASRVRTVNASFQPGSNNPWSVFPGTFAAGSTAGFASLDAGTVSLGGGPCASFASGSVVDAVSFGSATEGDPLLFVLRASGLELAQGVIGPQGLQGGMCPPDAGSCQDCGYDADAGLWLRRAVGVNTAIAVTAPPGYVSSRLALSDRKALPPGTTSGVIGAVAVIFAPLDGGTQRLVSSSIVTESLFSMGPVAAPQYSFSDLTNWGYPIAVCPGTASPLALQLTCSGSGNNNNVNLIATCTSGVAATSTGGTATVSAGTWQVEGRSRWNDPVSPSSPARVGYVRLSEDSAPLNFPTVELEGNAQTRGLAGPSGRTWEWPALSGTATPTMPSRRVLERVPEAVVRIAQGPGSLFERVLGGQAMALDRGIDFISSPLGLVSEVNAGSGKTSLDVAGPVRAEPSLLLLRTAVLDVRHFPLGYDQPQLLAVPVGGALQPPAVGELVTVNGRTWLYVSSGDALWTADVTAQLANELEPSAALTRAFSPVPSVSLRGMALGLKVGTIPGQRDVVSGYVLAGASVYQFEGLPPNWTVAQVPTSIGAGEPIDVTRSVDAQGENVFRVAFDTGVLASLPAPVPLTAPILDGGDEVSHVTSLCGDTYALSRSGLFIYGAGDGGVAVGGWTLVRADAGAALFPSKASFFVVSRYGDVLEFADAWDAGYPVCPP